MTHDIRHLRDFRPGIPATELVEGVPVAGELDGQPILLVRANGEFYAVAATCPHYGAPLEDGLVVGGTLRCPWHHACFELATGKAHAPALQPLPGWQVIERAGRVYLAGPRPAARPAARPVGADPRAIAIVGAGAAGSTAAATLRQQGFGGRVLLIDPDESAPYDRPNLSKDYLAGNAPEEWLPLRSSDYWQEQGIERLVDRVVSLDLAAHTLSLAAGDVIGFDRLLLATGASPLRPPIAGADQAHVHVLRSLADCRALIAQAERARSAVIAGASFIGMEAAAALRTRGLAITVVAPEAVPFERTLGGDIGAALRRLHEQHGVAFRLGRTLAGIEAAHVVLDDGERLAADVVLLGIGVRPLLQLAAEAGLAVGDGVLVDEYLESSVTGVYAAGDIAAWLDGASGERRRVEHWVVAQRQGEAAALNLLGAHRPYRAVPFFWTQQYDAAVAYSGYGRGWERAELVGNAAELDCAVRYYRADRAVALATINRDRDNLEFERALEQQALEVES